MVEHGQRAQQFLLVATLILGLGADCLARNAPVVPPGWTVHYYQDRPYFYNEDTGETTWHLPRPLSPDAGGRPPHGYPRNPGKEDVDPGSSAQETPLGQKRPDPTALPLRNPSSRTPPPSSPQDSASLPLDRPGWDEQGPRRSSPATGERGAWGWLGFGKRGAPPQQHEQRQPRQRRPRQDSPDRYDSWQTRQDGGLGLGNTRDRDPGVMRGSGRGRGHERGYGRRPAGGYWGNEGDGREQPTGGALRQPPEDGDPADDSEEPSYPSFYTFDRFGGTESDRRPALDMGNPDPWELPTEAPSRDGVTPEQKTPGADDIPGDGGESSSPPSGHPALPGDETSPTEDSRTLSPAAAPGGMPLDAALQGNGNGTVHAQMHTPCRVGSNEYLGESGSDPGPVEGSSPVADGADDGQGSGVWQSAVASGAGPEPNAGRGTSAMTTEQNFIERESPSSAAGAAPVALQTDTAFGNEGGRVEERMEEVVSARASDNLQGGWEGGGTRTSSESNANKYTRGSEGQFPQEPVSSDTQAPEPEHRDQLPEGTSSQGLASGTGVPVDSLGTLDRKDGQIPWDIGAAEGESTVSHGGIAGDPGAAGAIPPHDAAKHDHFPGQPWQQEWRVQGQGGLDLDGGSPRQETTQTAQAPSHEPKASGTAWGWEDPWAQGAPWGAPDQNVGPRASSKERKVPEPSVPASTFEDPLYSFYGEGEGFRPQGTGSSWYSENVPQYVPEKRPDDERGLVEEERKKRVEAEQVVAEARKELEGVREAERELRSTLEKQEEKLKASEALGAAAKEAAAAATAAAFSAAQEELESVRQRAAKAERALEVLDSDHEELKMQLDASRGNSTSLVGEVDTLKGSAKEAGERAEAAETKLKGALEDVEMLDDALKQYMDGEWKAERPALSWRRISDVYLRPLLPSRLRTPTPQELEMLRVNRSLARAMENSTALAEAVSSKDDLIKDLNSRLKQFQLQTVRRKKGYKALKLGLAELTDEVHAKEAMMAILAVCMFGTHATLENMHAALQEQQADLARATASLREQEEQAKVLVDELVRRDANLTEMARAFGEGEEALASLAASFGAKDDFLERWKAAIGLGDPDARMVVLRDLHAAAASMFLSPLGLEPSTGAITIAVPRTVSKGHSTGHDHVDECELGGVGGAQGDPGRRRSPGFWGSLLNLLCCRRGAGRH